MLVVYSPTCPSSRSAASTYWTRAGLSVYPGVAMRGCGGPGGEVIAMLCKASVVPEHPSPRETCSRRESNEESPESRRLFGAVWGAAAVRLPLIGLGQVFVVPECPLPCQAHPHRESNEESPESRRLFGAGLGARSPQRTPRGKHGKANMITQKRALPRRRLRSPSPASLSSPLPSSPVGIAIKKRASPK